ncbi:hypothetical protein SEVIR_5G038150v4 [Setaria viridis]|uniref:Uncharacterized protein n=1 Tax=Setaria viridis TaxID=4556 RepID=A0A4U6U9T0_SETVI|nr:hypothetical protein SEVIR_5G038150v2 [Setaria viridis]
MSARCQQCSFVSMLQLLLMSCSPHFRMNIYFALMWLLERNLPNVADQFGMMSQRFVFTFLFPCFAENQHSLEVANMVCMFFMIQIHAH